ncbi:unnamed protein product [Trichobilharzia regenti]|nr:unnamed protein product [Trichobilharzia regenti]
MLKQLSDVLINTECSPHVRTQAGIQLKNALYSKDPSVKTLYQQRWLQAPLETRQYIKKNCLMALGTETTTHSSAAQCVAYIACAEIPAHQWPDLMGRLVENVITPNKVEACKRSTLEAIGYICQDIDPCILASQSNAILTAIVCGMKKEEPSDGVRLAATNALLNSLEFTKHNFDNERNYIMQVVCESTQSPSSHIRVAALQCLVKIMSLYYTYMEPYMKQALFAITLDAMKDSVPEVALQGIEFWSTVCDEEIDLAIDVAECFDKGQPPAVSSMFYAKGALQFIVPILMEILAQQDESMDDDEWNPSKAAGVCLMLLAQCCEDPIVNLVIPFVKENIKKPDWRYRDAAVMSFGSILEGPDPAALKVSLFFSVLTMHVCTLTCNTDIVNTSLSLVTETFSLFLMYSKFNLAEKSHLLLYPVTTNDISWLFCGKCIQGSYFQPNWSSPTNCSPDAIKDEF